MTSQELNEQSALDAQTVKSRKFGWKAYLLRIFVVALLAISFGYIQAVGIINVHSGVEAQLLAPAVIGLTLSILNLRYLVKISLLLLPIWFAAAVAIEFAGIFLAEMFHNGFQETLSPFVIHLLEYLPAAIAGHWLYSGYSSFARRKSLLVYLAVVLFSVLIAFLVYADYNIYLLESVYLIFVAALLSSLHLMAPPKK